MFDTELWFEAITAIRSQGIRAVLTAFGVFWGMFLLVLLLGIGKGLEQGTLLSFGGYAKNSLFLWEGQRSIPFGSAPAGKPAHGRVSDIDLLRRAIPEISLISPRARTDGSQTVVSRESSAAFPIYGVYPDFASIESLKLTSGRFISDIDLNRSRRFAVVGQRVATTLFSHPKPERERITILNVSFEIVGVIKSSSLGGGPSDTDDSIFIPYTSLLGNFKIPAPTEVIAVAANAGLSSSELKKKAVQILSARRQFDPQDVSALFVYDHEGEIQSLRSLFSALNLFVWAVGFGTLLCGMVGVSNIMLVSVRERTKEFGVRKALGATSYLIISSLLREAFLLTAISGYGGVVAGVAALECVRWWGFSSPYFRDPGVNLSVALGSLILLIFSGMIAGLIPALRASRIAPVEALRTVS